MTFRLSYSQPSPRSCSGLVRWRRYIQKKLATAGSCILYYILECESGLRQIWMASVSPPNPLSFS
jgi:hypothetical protein